MNKKNEGLAEADHIGGLPLSKTMVPNSFGAIWCDREKDRYEADANACRLLDIAAHGTVQTEWLLRLIDQVSPTDEPKQRFHTFRNHEGKILRSRMLPQINASMVIVVEELQNIADRFWQLGQNEREYRELFENASYGLYRANLAGQVTQANPAFLRLHGFESEGEMAAAIGKTSHHSYVDPGRLQHFIAELNGKGKVVDFISEVYRHRSQERIWVSESAWLVRDAGGRPGYVAGTVVEITERMRYIEKMRHAAETDALTGLSNRAHFISELERRIAAEPGETFAVLVIDCDRFKEINDVYGHARGDAVLRVCAGRLKNLVPPNGLLARLGGDEFAMLLPTPDAGAALETARRVSEFIERPIKIAGASHLIGASTGISMFPDHGSSARDLLKNSDLALYRVKESGRGFARMFDVELAREKQRRHAIERDLRDAESRGELELHYQPIIDVVKGRAVGVEALLRWRHPSRGLVLPGEFIPVAEDAGMMLELGRWVIEEACRQAVALPTHLAVAVNVSALQFRSSDIAAITGQALEAAGLEPGRLEIEVTESAVIRQEEATIRALDALRALGVRVALDDFGTGYSSLSYLQKYKFDKVKIDRSFVQQIRVSAANAAITRAVLSIGRDLGLEVVAEGIETPADSAFLLEQGCRLQQGFNFAAPATLVDLAATLALEAFGRAPWEAAHSDPQNLSLTA